MKKLLCLAAAVSLPAAATGQEACEAGRLANGGERWSMAVMERPGLGETQLVEAAQAASRNLVIARQTITVAPRVRYLAAPIVLVDAEGDELAHSVPLGRGAPITVWRDAGGLKHCAIGWRNGLFGGATGDGHLRWVCLEDRDGDGAFDNAWRPHSRNLGLSFSRLDMPIDPPVASLDVAPGDTQVRTSERATLSERRFERKIVVARISNDSIRIESRLGQTGWRDRRIERRDVPLAGPAEIILSGITVTVTPTGRGAANVAARGTFTGEDVQLLCDDSQVVIGGLAIHTSFAFPNW